MRLVNKSIEKDGAGEISLIPERVEDMWHVYNLFQIDDVLRATTMRRVQSQSNTGSVSNTRVRTVLSLKISDIWFDFEACSLRVSGRNVVENQYVKMGAFHTIDLELQRKFTLSKQEWDLLALKRVDQACDPAQSADVVAVVMQEGLGYLCYITSDMTLVKSKIEVSIPRKRRTGCSQHDKGLEKFYEQVLQAIIKFVNFEIVKCIILGSPGFVKDQCMDYIVEQCIKRDNKTIMDNKSKFLLVHTSSGHKHSLQEALQDPSVMAQLADTKAAKEAKSLDAFFKMLNTDPNRAFYGYKHVSLANEELAIETLMVSDHLFRSRNLATRKKYVKLVESVQDNGGVILIFSSMHVTGEQLKQVSGIAAILRYPLPHLEEGCSSDEDEDKEEMESLDIARAPPSSDD